MISKLHRFYINIFALFLEIFAVKKKMPGKFDILDNTIVEEDVSIAFEIYILK